MIWNTFQEIIDSNINAYYEWQIGKKQYIHLKNLLKETERKYLLNQIIVFNPVRWYKSILDREFFLGKLLALNGARVYMLLDDNIMKHTDTIQIDNILKIEKFRKFKFNTYPVIHKELKYFLKSLFYKKLINLALKIYKDENLKIIFYSDIIKNIDYENWRNLRNFAKSSTIRFFKTSILDYNDKNVKYFYNISLINAILSRSIGEFVVEKLKPDIFITSHGIYSTWGPAYELIEKSGIKSFIYASAHGHSYNYDEIFISDTIIQKLTRSTFWHNYKNTEVTEEMKNKVEDYFKKRQNFLTKDGKFLFKGKINTYKVNKNDGYKYHLALFPNVIWDGDIIQRHTAFEGYIDWITSTINYLKNNKHIKLYIKSHPSEITVLKNSPRIVDIINNQISLNQVKNVVLIPPEMRINTYDFFRSGIDLGIVYDGFLGVEMPYLKVPTIICTDQGYFSVEGGNYVIKAKKEYFEYLDNIEELIKEFHDNFNKIQENIIRYVYWYIFEIAIKLPTLSKFHYIGTNLNQLKKKDLCLDSKFLKLIQSE